ncbi:MAG: CDP-glycerol glycerophosphotransferase family protein [Desulfobulbaceae bacterium]|nr:CDP-glycerol glycerophosphotransferase family protein [Desulfobulbaceae bacterium]
MAKSKDIFNATGQILISLLASFVFIPLSMIIPKKKGRIVVIGRQNDLFMDNAKHFFLFLSSSATPKPDAAFLVFSKETRDLLAQSVLRAFIYPGWKSILYLLTANLVIVDSAEWIVHGKFQLAFGSKVIQLWHGAPLKQIELPLYHQRMAKYPALIRSLFDMYKFVTGRHAAVELVVSTSSFFTEKAFRPAFRAKRFVDTGYPRNDALFADTEIESLHLPIFLNTDRETILEIMSRKKSGAKVILYAPTFRKGLDDPFSTGIFDLSRLDAFSRRNNLFVVLKLHPVMAEQMPEGQYSNIAVYNATSDIYPVLNLFDALVTDYSSIYFDYLLFDRPIIFYPYDYDAYISNDRSLLFDYEQMAPGHICMNQDEMETALRELADDPHTQKRSEVLDLVFTHKDNMASARLWQILKKNFID